MTEAEQEVQKHLSVLKAEGYEINQERFQKLNAWTRILYQVNSARKSLEILSTREPNLGNIDDVSISTSLFYGFVLQYCKCFTSAGSGLVSLDPNKVFQGRPPERTAHDHLIEIRHNLAAHNGHSDYLHTSIASKEDSEKISIRHVISTVLPGNERNSYFDVLAALDEYVILSHNKYLDRLEKELGKPIVVGKS
jgi:CRISPR/Cas system-associated protein endoribonuclease Cas2